MMHFHAQLYTGWTKRGGGGQRKKEDMGQRGDTGTGQSKRCAASKCLSLLLQSEIHSFGLNCAQTFCKEKFIPNLKGKMFPVKLSHDKTPPPLYIHQMLDTIGNSVLSAVAVF